MKGILLSDQDVQRLAVTINKTTGYKAVGGLLYVNGAFFQYLIEGQATKPYSVIFTQSDVIFKEESAKQEGAPLGTVIYENSWFVQAFGDAPDGSGGGGETTPSYYYVLTIAGQSNSMAYGEGVPLPETLDKVSPRIKQMARRSTEYPGGPACKYNDVIPLDHCPHDVQNMSLLNNPGAVLPAQYGCVSQALHIAKKLLPYLPADAGVLVVPCARGGAAFTAGNDGTYNVATGASEDSTRWGVGKPLYTDMVARTKAALDANPRNVFMGVVWMQGEFDLQQPETEYGKQPGLFDAMRVQFSVDMQSHLKQVPGYDMSKLPWVCGGTTYWWRNQYPRPYRLVYGNYSSRQKEAMHFVPLCFSPDGVALPTNLPAEDPNIPAADYFGAAERTSANWTTSGRQTHFSSFARRGPVATALAVKLLEVCDLTMTGNVPNETAGDLTLTAWPAETPFALASTVAFSMVASGGKPPYTYAWRNGAGLVFNADNADLTLTSNAGAALNNVDIIGVVSDSMGNCAFVKTTLKQQA